jgi:demethoxyubiquinone hydroxylase (CLK1/Coq7/Cat5 family)
MLRGETPEYLPPAWKYLFFAISVTSGLVNKKITTKSTRVVNPRVNAKPRTLPTDTI